jgi:hypothetical protein
MSTSKTFEWRGGGSFEKTTETVTFRGTSYTIGLIDIVPPLEAAVRVELGPKDFEAHIKYDIDKS